MHRTKRSRRYNATSCVNFTDYLVKVPVGLPGLEPGASALSGQRSNHLS